MEGKMGFRPLNEDHAIQSVKFSVLLTGGIAHGSILTIEQNHNRWRDNLPARTIADVEIESNGRTGKAPGVIFAFVRPDGSPSWSLSVAANRIDIECNLYSRWERVWHSAKEYFVKILEILSTCQAELEIAGIELTVKDVFVVDRNAYSLDHLLNHSSRLPSYIFSAGQAWHANCGWFQDEEPPNRTLHHLNCDTAADQDLTFVNISHYQQRSLMPSQKKSDEKPDKSALLDRYMRELHLSNKQLLSDLLADQMAERINLWAASNVHAR